ncbi:uncharacterized protein SAPINGB_P005790 [Magnusiomyces paraingens]|uniref:Ubiquitin-like protein ATG12 n=1 Tax=Magnusiomyces paraingens TaxID=2606893 RepID=A0A5E8C6W9_9ASCO|nr:uncharacterized protein SAPINGB_P005790 [Saprochaete ingens]VVT57628.1 unnamed protein product [Saprochaete ingens]
MATAADQIPDDDDEDRSGPPPVSLSASVVLAALPADSSQLLSRTAATAASIAAATKVTLRLRPIGSAAPLKQSVYRIPGAQTFASLVKFLRKQLKCPPSQSIFCYINNSFAPALDEPLINLYHNFAVDEHLIISYCYTVAFG